MNFGSKTQKQRCVFPLAIKGEECRFPKLFGVMGKDRGGFFLGLLLIVRVEPANTFAHWNMESH